MFKAPFNFSLLDSNFSIWTYKAVQKDDSLVILRELDLTKEPAAHAASSSRSDRTGITHAVLVATAAHASPAAGTAVGNNYWTAYEQAKEEFEKTGKIKGFEILNLRTLEKLWVSHYDMEVF